MSNFYVYVMAYKPTKMIYIGLTENLKQRVSDHKNNIIAGFPSDYKVDCLIYYELFDNYSEAAARSEELNQWKNREWLLTIISHKNPLWRDLYQDIEVYV